MKVLPQLFSNARSYLFRTAMLMALIGLFISPSLISAAVGGGSNATPIPVINGQTTATYYPSPIDLSAAGISGVVTNVTVTLSGINHSRPDDFDIVLVGPNSVGGLASVLLMSDAGGGTAISGVNLTFADGAPSGALPDSTQISSGTYIPTNYDSAQIEDAGDPFIAAVPGAPRSLALSAFNGANPNTTWNLYVHDDRSLGSVGGIDGGWSISITTNDSPVAGDDAATTDENNAVTIAVLANDSDAELEALTPSLVANAANGNAVLNVDNTFTYTPNAGFDGTDSFTYRVTDGSSFSNTATVTITVNAVNGAPSVNAGADLSGTVGVAVNVAATYTDPDVGDTHTATINWGDGTIDSPAAAGGAVNGSHAYAAAGTYTVTVTVTDNTAASGSDILIATITDVGAPTATAPAPGVTPTAAPFVQPTATTLPLLTDYNGVTIDDAMRADVPLEIRYGIFARLIVRNGSYIRHTNSGMIGHPGLLNLDVRHAVDITTVPGLDMSAGVRLCFNGRGTVFFLDAAGAPRTPVEIGSTYEDGRTCVYIYTAGTVVVTRNGVTEPEPTPAAETLASCEIVTVYNLNLRAEPSLDSTVLTIIPDGVTLNPVGSADGWYHVTYQELDGWVAAEFVTPGDGCTA